MDIHNLVKVSTYIVDDDGLTTTLINNVIYRTVNIYFKETIYLPIARGLEIQAVLTSHLNGIINMQTLEQIRVHIIRILSLCEGLGELYHEAPIYPETCGVLHKYKHFDLIP